MGEGKKNVDGRENGEKYNVVGKASAKFKETVCPNDSVSKLGHKEGAE